MKDPESPLAPRLLRRVVAIGALLCAPVALAIAVFAWLFSGSPVTVLGGLLIVLGAGPTAWAVWTGSLRHDLKAVGTTVFAAGLAGALAVGLAYALEAWRGREPFAYAATDTTLALGYVAAIALCGALIAASVVRRSRARPVVLAALGIAALFGATALGATTAEGGCRAFAFDSERWRAALDAVGQEGTGGVSDAERIAGALARCGVLADKDRQAVRRLLGTPVEDEETEPGSDRWLTGEINDELGPGDAGELTVVYDQAGRVTAVDPPTG